MTRQEAIETIKTAIAEVEWEYPMDYTCAFETAIAALEQPEVVRCEDCKHQDPERLNDGSGCFVCRKGHGWKPDDWFCADGKRKEDHDKEDNNERYDARSDCQTGH